MELQQFVANAARQFIEARGGREPRDLKQQFARERIAIGVQAGRGQADQHVAGTNFRSRQHALALHRSHDEAG